MADNESRMEKTVNSLKEEYKSIRTGRASAAIFDKVRVDYYGTPTPLNQVGNISIPEARTIVISPFDKSIMGDIEKAIQKAELGLNPNNDGKVIRIAIPPLTADRRKELVKQAKATAENYRTTIRNIRRDGNEDLKKQQKAGNAQAHVRRIAKKYQNCCQQADNCTCCHNRYLFILHKKPPQIFYLQEVYHSARASSNIIYR